MSMCFVNFSITPSLILQLFSETDMVPVCFDLASVHCAWSYFLFLLLPMPVQSAHHHSLFMSPLHVQSRHHHYQLAACMLWSRHSVRMVSIVPKRTNMSSIRFLWVNIPEIQCTPTWWTAGCPGNICGLALGSCPCVIWNAHRWSRSGSSW